MIEGGRLKKRCHDADNPAIVRGFLFGDIIGTKGGRIMALNKDGLDPSKPVDFETLMRVKREQKERKHGDSESAKPKGRKKAVRRSVKQSDEDSSEPTVSEEA